MLIVSGSCVAVSAGLVLYARSCNGKGGGAAVAGLAALAGAGVSALVAIVTFAFWLGSVS